MTVATCPHCEEAVTVPPGVLPETRVACPLCQEELTGEEFIGQLPPALVLLDTPAMVEIETETTVDSGDTLDPDNPFGDVREATQWYDGISPELGDRFRIAVDGKLDSLAAPALGEVEVTGRIPLAESVGYVADIAARNLVFAR